MGNTQGLDIDPDPFLTVPIPIHFCAYFHLHFWPPLLALGVCWSLQQFSRKNIDWASILWLFLLWIAWVRIIKHDFVSMSQTLLGWGVAIWTLSTIIWISQVVMQNIIIQPSLFLHSHKLTSVAKLKWFLSRASVTINQKSVLIPGWSMKNVRHTHGL